MKRMPIGLYAQHFVETVVLRKLVQRSQTIGVDAALRLDGIAQTSVLDLG
jgi:hypothetical protein